MVDDELTAMRRRLPVGARVRGRVEGLPCGAGQAGVSVDLGDPVRGWVDIAQLPSDPARWPLVGASGFFEILEHRRNEIRLFPLDVEMRGEMLGKRYTYPRWSNAQWSAITRRWPIGARLSATVIDVFPGNRQYTVRFGDYDSTVDYEGPPPRAGSAVTLLVERLLESTRRIVLRPVE